MKLLCRLSILLLPLVPPLLPSASASECACLPTFVAAGGGVGAAAADDDTAMVDISS